LYKLTQTATNSNFGS